MNTSRMNVCLMILVVWMMSLSRDMTILGTEAATVTTSVSSTTLSPTSSSTTPPTTPSATTTLKTMTPSPTTPSITTKPSPTTPSITTKPSTTTTPSTTTPLDESIVDVQNFTMTNRTETSVTLEWIPSDVNISLIEEYSVKWNTTDGSGSNSTNGTFITIINLQPGQLYTFKLLINASYGGKSFCFEHNSPLTERTFPNPPTDIKLINQTGPNIIIHFKLAAGKVDYYNATLKLRGDIINNTKVSNTTNEIVFQDLNGGTTYILEIVTHTGNLVSQPRKKNITTSVTKPGPIQNATTSNYTSSGFLITWSAPEQPNGKIEEYIIQAFIGNVCHTNNTISICDDVGDSNQNDKNSKQNCSNTTQYWLTELIPSQMFTVTIAAKNEAGVGEKITINAKTTEGDNIMDPRHFTMTTRTERTISFEWQSPDLRAPFRNINYTVNWTTTSETGSNSTTAHAIMISDLKPGQKYTFTLIFHLFDGENTFVYEHKKLLKERTIPCRPTFHKNNSDLTPPNITIAYSQAEGIVDYYIVTLRNNSNDVVGNKTVFNDTANVTFEGLDGGTVYNLTFVTQTGDVSSKTPIEEIQTKTIVPGKPTITNVSVLSATSVNICWSPPSIMPGTTDYMIMVFEEERINSTTYRHNSSILISGYFSSSYTVSDLYSYWNYKFIVTANTTAGSTNSTSDPSVRTEQSAPGVVQSLEVMSILDIYTEVNVTWACPREKERNGLITKYVLQYTADQQRRTVLENSSGIEIKMDPSDPCTLSHNKRIKVTPEVNYTFSVTAFTVSKGPNITKGFYARPGKPPSLNTTVLIRMPTEPQHLELNETRFIVDYCASCLTSKTHGIVIFVGMIICKTGTTCVVPGDHLKIPNWYNWSRNDYKGVYQPTPAYWLTGKGKSRTGRSLDPAKSAPNDRDYVRFEVGTDKECQEKHDEYCNGPLDSGSQYSVKFISCTKAGCTESEFQQGFFTKAPPESNPVGVILGAICGIVLGVLIIVGVLFYIRRYRKQKEGDSGSDSETEDPVDLTRPIKMCDFNKRLQELHKDSDLLFTDEFEEILSNSPQRAFKTACLEQNRLKNRYVNILPFDHSLVKLMPIDDDDNAEYINANFIPGYNSPREYIATQGTLDSTINDFWRMVWERKVSIIVMLTGISEDKKPKCAMYWPDEVNVETQYGDLVVMLDSISTFDKYILKIFKIHLGTSERTVKHFFKIGWKDYDANLIPIDVANFICDVRRERLESEPGPIVVHCSAGVGRTGTFIAIDYYMQFINNHDLQEYIDIFQFVLKMREHRPHMVQAEKQYVFIHETVDMLIQQKISDDEDPGDGDDNEQIYQNEGFVQEENIYINIDNEKKDNL